MKTREFREIQVSSTQLAIIFLGILAIGVVIFLLGVSVGKRHVQVAKQANVIAQKAPEQVKEKMVSLPQEEPDLETLQAAAGKPTPARTDAAPVKTTVVPKKTVDKAQPETRSEVAGAPAESAAPGKKGLFYVQVGAVAEKDAAQDTAQKFGKLGYPVIVLDPQPTDKKPVFRVRIGGFATRQQAEEARSKLSSAAGKKTDYFIVRD
jgi:cell division septation protein DedD